MLFRSNNLNDLTQVYANSSQLLEHFPNLTSLYYMFRKGSINFTTKSVILDNDGKIASTGTKVEYCDLFFNNPKLTSVEYSFDGVNMTGSLKDLFGGHELLLK